MPFIGWIFFALLAAFLVHKTIRSYEAGDNPLAACYGLLLAVLFMVGMIYA